MKTNQFNMTTRRHDEQKIHKFMKEGWVFSGRVKDRFGDYGLTLLAIVSPRNEYTKLDTLLMSCRVMSRQVEKAFFSRILKRLKAKGVKVLEVSYLPTEKNIPVREFMETLDFKPLKTKKTGEKIYLINLDKHSLPTAPRFIKIAT